MNRSLVLALLLWPALASSADINSPDAASDLLRQARQQAVETLNQYDPRFVEDGLADPKQSMLCGPVCAVYALGTIYKDLRPQEKIADPAAEVEHLVYDLYPQTSGFDAQDLAWNGIAPEELVAVLQSALDEKSIVAEVKALPYSQALFSAKNAYFILLYEAWDKRDFHKSRGKSFVLRKDRISGHFQFLKESSSGGRLVLYDPGSLSKRLWSGRVVSRNVEIRDSYRKPKTAHGELLLKDYSTPNKRYLLTTVIRIR